MTEMAEPPPPEAARERAPEADTGAEGFVRTSGWVVLGLALLPMGLMTLGMLSMVGTSCKPGHERHLGEMASALAVAWAIWSVPALPCVLFLRRRKRTLGGAVAALVLALTAGAFSLIEMFILSLATMC